MPETEPAPPFAGWAGFHAVRTDRYEANGVTRPTAEIWIELASHRRRREDCSVCLKPSRRIHDWEERWGRDLPILDARNRSRLHAPAAA